MRRAVLLALVGIVAVLGAQAAGPEAESRAMVEWPHWAGDLAGSHYSPLTDINASNVSQLQVAWEWITPDKIMPEFNAAPGAVQSTPLMIDNVVYFTTPFGKAVALDAETGKQLWLYDPESYRDLQASASGWGHRGLAAWRDGNKNLRLLLSAKHRLIALDAKTGKPVPTFGRNGEVDISAELSTSFDKALLSSAIPPTVYKDTVIVGSGVGDRLMYKNDPPGVLRAYHLPTGRNVWNFYVIPQSPREFGADTWGNGSWEYTGHANVWAVVAVDAQRGLVYVPTSTPSNDYYGGRRPGANLFAESLVVLDAKTGLRKWHFQTTHHGLWDYDIGSQPNLMTITVDGKRIDAVAQVTKLGFTFVFDRVTGAPVWPIEERPVPTDTDVPGEQVYPTQPFPTKPPPFGLQGFTLDDAFDLTPELKAAAQEEIKKYRYGPLYTPPSLKGTLMRPSDSGSIGWGGAAWDQETGLLYVKSSDVPTIARVAKFERDKHSHPITKMSDAEYIGGPMNFPMPLTFMNGLPLAKPPYSTLTAIDLNRGEFRWRIPFGKGSDLIRNHPALAGVTLPERLGTPGNPSSVVTKGGLLFIGGGDRALYALDKATGKELWEHPLARRASGTPMTYRSRSGRQFVLIATGAGSDGALVAFALPRAQ